MKQIVIAFATLAIIMVSCKKESSKEEEKVTPPIDTSQYISFVITGDSLVNETIRIDTGAVRYIDYFYEKNNPTQYYLRFSIRVQKTKTGVFQTLGNFAIPSVSAPGIYTFDNGAAIGEISLPDQKGKPGIRGKTGSIKINNLPTDTSEYLTGSFEGVFENNHANNPDVDFSISKGQFRIRYQKQK